MCLSVCTEGSRYPLERYGSFILTGPGEVYNYFSSPFHYKSPIEKKNSPKDGVLPPTSIVNKGF